MSENDLTLLYVMLYVNVRRWYDGGKPATNFKLWA